MRAGSVAVVTGAAGFVGSHLVDALLGDGYQVVGVDRRGPGTDDLAALNLSGPWEHPRFAFVEADLCNANLDAVLRGVDRVFHLAAVPGVRSSWEDSGFASYVASNIVGTQRLVGASERAGVARLVYASSSSVYGSADAPSRECDPTAPISPYGVTKLAGEQLCLAHAARADTGLSVVALRYFTVYGPRQRPDMAIGRVLAAALSGGDYRLFGDGTQRREFTYVEDVVAATVAAANIDARAVVVNVGGGSSVTMLDVVRLAREVTGNPVPLIRGATQAGDVAVTSADLSRATELLGYQPRTDLRRGMARQAEWLRRLPPDLLRRFTAPIVPIEEALTCSS